MNREELIEHNITLIFDFLRKVVENPSIIDDIEDNTIIEFVEKDKQIIESKNKKN